MSHQPRAVQPTATTGRVCSKRTAWWSFHGRIGSEVLEITIYSHRDLEQLLRGFNAACNDRRQPVPDSKTLNQVVAWRLKARRKLVRGETEGRAGADDIARARLIAESAKEVSQPDKLYYREPYSNDSRIPHVWKDVSRV